MRPCHSNIRAIRPVVWSAVVFSLLGATGAHAQSVQMGAWRGALEGVVEFAHQETKNGSAQDQIDTRYTEESISLQNSGIYYYDPRLLLLSIGGTFGLSQEDITDQGSRNGQLWSYDLLANLLSDSPLSLDAFANRHQFSLTRQLSGRTDITNETHGVTLHARRLYIPSRVTFRQEHPEQESRTSGVTSRRDNQLNIIHYEGMRGWDDSEMSAEYEYIDDTDNIFSDQSYKSHESSLFYSLDFGPELNRRWDSQAHYFTRAGAGGISDLTTNSVSELLRIDHTPALETTYRYLLTHTDAPGGSATSHTGEVALQHKLYDSLVTRVGLDTILQELPGGNRDIYGGDLKVSYVKLLPADARFGADLGGRFRYEDDQFGATESFVAQETHTAATPFAVPIALDRPFAVTSSIVVTKIALGPPTVGCAPPSRPPTPLFLGQDYTLRTVGNITEIVPIPCAGLVSGINPGDTIAVDYSFAVPNSLAFTTAVWHAALFVDYGWVRPYYTHEQLDETLVSGQGGQFLDDQHSDTIGIEFRYDGIRWRWTLLGEGRRYVSTQQTYTSFRSGQFLDFAVLRELTLTVNAEQSYFDFSRPDNRTSQYYRGAALLSYALNGNLFVNTSAEFRQIDDSMLPSERRTDAAFRVRWFIQQLEVSPSLEYYDARRGNSQTSEVRVALRVIRRF
jgi:hypothetical protein